MSIVTAKTTGRIVTDRDELIVACERAIKFDASQESIGEVWAYLKAGCKFTAIESEGKLNIDIEHATFSSYEHGEGDQSESFEIRVPSIKLNYTRDELIDICKRAIVPAEKWSDRDSPESQRKVGVAWQKLTRGDGFEIQRSGTCATDERTIWLEFADGDTAYLPTEKRLEDSNGRDWY